ncbi:MAG: helix-turn-helix domain-containing protein [Enterocloster clostridioformis]
MKDGSGHTDTRTIQKVCMLLDCQPGDIMEYILRPITPTGRSVTLCHYQKNESILLMIFTVCRMEKGQN